MLCFGAGLFCFFQQSLFSTPARGLVLKVSKNK